MDEIRHSAKGSTWKKHKYTAIKNGRYIYPNNSKNKTGPNWWTPPDDDQFWDESTDNKTQTTTRRFKYNTHMSPNESWITRIYKNDTNKRLDYDRRHNQMTIQNQITRSPDHLHYDYETMGVTERNARDYGRQETALEKRMQDPNYKRVISDRAFNKQHTLSKGTNRPANGVAVSKARDEGRKAVREQKQKNIKNTSRDTGRKVEVKSKGSYANKAKAAVSAAAKKVSAATKSSVSKGRSAVSSALSKLSSLFKKRG